MRRGRAGGCTLAPLGRLRLADYVGFDWNVASKISPQCQLYRGIVRVAVGAMQSDEQGTLSTGEGLFQFKWGIPAVGRETIGKSGILNVRTYKVQNTEWQTTMNGISN